MLCGYTARTVLGQGVINRRFLVLDLIHWLHIHWLENSIEHVYNIPIMEFFNGISRPTLSNSYWHGPLGVTSMSTVEVVITTNQSTVVLYPSLVEWFLHTKAVGGLCMPTNECSKGKNCCSPKHYHTHPTHIFRQVNFACHCTPLFTK